jgi:hypothetical protein
MSTHRQGKAPHHEADPAFSQRATPASVPQGEPVPERPEVTPPLAAPLEEAHDGRPRCPDCGVLLVAGAAHFSGCPTHAGEVIQNIEAEPEEGQ